LRVRASRLRLYRPWSAWPPAAAAVVVVAVGDDVAAAAAAVGTARMIAVTKAT